MRKKVKYLMHFLVIWNRYDFFSVGCRIYVVVWLMFFRFFFSVEENVQSEIETNITCGNLSKESEYFDISLLFLFLLAWGGKVFKDLGICFGNVGILRLDLLDYGNFGFENVWDLGFVVFINGILRCHLRIFGILGFIFCPSLRHLIFGICVDFGIVRF